MSTLQTYGSLVLGSRLRRLSDQLYAGVDSSYVAAGVELSSRCFPLLMLLRDNGPTSITVLAAQIGQTHPVVVQLGRKLLEAGVVVEGKAAAWIATLDKIEANLQEQAFGDVIATCRRQRERAAVEIIDYEAQYASDFKRLNVEWLERYFYVEALDDQVLSDPQVSILDGGGQIFLARLDGRIVGTCCLISTGADSVELSKMAVTPACQGLGIARRLLLRALQAYQDSGARLLFLESNGKLLPAIQLYESTGFVHVARPDGEVHYQRADVYMEWSGHPA